MGVSVPARLSSDAALALFDGLPTVAVTEMTGRWRGDVIETGHPLDDLLGAARWYGKVFEGPEAVHPLVHRGLFGGMYRVNPALLPLDWGMRLPFAAQVTRLLFPLVGPLMATSRPRARLRMVAHRGVVTAAMIYDAKPVIDLFRRIDDQSVMGLMDQRGAAAPFFFRLTRQG